MQTVLLVFIVLFALAIGFFLGLFLLSLDTPLTRSLTKKETQPEDISSTELISAGPAAEMAKPSPGSQLILQIWREEGKPPVFEQNGNYFAKEDLPRELLNVITVQEVVPQTPDPSPAPSRGEVSIPSGKSLEIDEKGVEEEIKMLSVVDEVNNILQKKLIGSALAGKGIHLMENHKNEIRFWVGLNSYDDVEDIPDPEVREFINSAVKEWERNRE